MAVGSFTTLMRGMSESAFTRATAPERRFLAMMLTRALDRLTSARSRASRTVSGYSGCGAGVGDGEGAVEGAVALRPARRSVGSMNQAAIAMPAITRKATTRLNPEFRRE